MKPRLILFWSLLLLFGALALWWTLYFPYSSIKLYRAIPANACLISEHRRVAERWKAIVENPVTRSLMIAWGVKPKDIDATTRDPNLPRLLEKLASRNTVLAFVPALGGSGRPAWVLASWVGGYGQLSRWGMARGLLSDFTRTRRENGSEIWVGAPAEKGSEWRLSLATAEGVLLACLSTNPNGVGVLLDRVEAGAPVLPELRAQMRAGGGDAWDQAVRAAPDRGWVRWYRPGVGGVDAVRLDYALTSVGSNDLSGEVRAERAAWNAGWGVSTGKLARVDDRELAALEGVLGNVPEAVVVVPLAWAEPFIEAGGARGPAVTIWEALKAEAKEGALAFACLFGGDFGGRILGIKAPAVMLGVQVRDGSQGVAVVDAIIDRLNAKYGWGLIPRRMEIAGQPARVFENIRGGLYGSLYERERPTVAAKDGWLLLASNRSTMEKILSADWSSAAAQGRGAARWRRDAAGKAACAYAWLDFEAAGRELRKAMAVYALVLMARNTDGSRQSRDDLERVRAAIDTIQPLKTGCAWMDADAVGLRASVRLGPSAVGPRRATAPADSGSPEAGKALNRQVEVR